MDRGAWWATVHGVAEANIAEHASSMENHLWLQSMWPLGPVSLHAGTGHHQSPRALPRVHPDLHEGICSGEGQGQGTSSERITWLEYTA